MKNWRFSCRFAAILLHPLFQNGAVFQQQMPIPVWGDAPAGHRIKAQLNGKEAYTRVNLSGSFMLRLPSMNAGGPYTLTVTDLDSGSQKVVKDIMVGEVFIASGQSNMAYAVNSDWRIDRSINYDQSVTGKQKKELLSALKEQKKFRFFKVPDTRSVTPEKTVRGSWQYADAEHVGNLSAIAAWFGKTLREKLDIPIGIIFSSVGGSCIEAWTSRAGMNDALCSRESNGATDCLLNSKSAWDGSPQKTLPCHLYAAPVRDNTGIKKGFAEIDFDDTSWRSMQVPGSWIIQKIAANGVVWMRKKVNIPASWQNADITINLGGVDKHDITYFNGVEAGRTGKDFECDYWNTPRCYKIPAKLVKTGENLIAVRAFSFIHDGSLSGKEKDYFLCNTKTGEKISISGQWQAFPEYEVQPPPPMPDHYSPHPDSQRTASLLFNGMIAPLVPYAVRAVIWYQGEGNAHSVSESRLYRQKMVALVRDWRYRWEQPKLPFFQVQLAGYEHSNPNVTWPHLRESQRLACKDIADLYLASAIDVGDPRDVHPQNKRDVGERLAANVLHNLYGFYDQLPSGPEAISCTALPDSNALAIKFANAEGMRIIPAKESSFELAGSDGKFYKADKVTVSGDTVTVSAVKAVKPQIVRYAWQNNPQSQLYNRANFPASSFELSTNTKRENYKMDEVKVINYVSKLDNSVQPALFLAASGDEPRPLAVCLHTWSYGINPPYDHFVQQCKARNWHFIFPLFRGPNKTPEACGSDLVVSDLECAVEYVKNNYPLDYDRVYLVGGSGGGHASLLLAGRSPQLWSAVSSWCPISDITEWFKYIHKIKNPEDYSYDNHIMAACGGDPTKDPAAAEQAKHRSPVTHLPNFKDRTILDLRAGIHDRAVPCSHAIRAFNILAPEQAISEEDIAYIVANEKIPPHLQYKGKEGANGFKILLERTSGNARLTIFDGGHSIYADHAFSFLELQKRNAPPVWDTGSFYKENVSELTK